MWLTKWSGIQKKSEGFSMKAGEIIVKRVEIVTTFDKAIDIESLKEMLPMKCAIDYRVDQTDNSLIFHKFGLSARIEDKKDWIKCIASSEEEVNPARHFLKDLAQKIKKYGKIDIAKSPRLEKCKLELITPFDYSKVLDKKGLKDLRFSKKDKTVQLKSLKFDIDSSLSLLIEELKATDFINRFTQRSFEKALEKYMPRSRVIRFRDKVYSSMERDFYSLLEKGGMKNLYRLEARGDSYEEVHSILYEILKTFPKNKRKIMQKRFRALGSRFSIYLSRNIEREAKDYGLPLSLTRRLLLEIRRDENAHNIRGRISRDYSISEFV